MDKKTKYNIEYEKKHVKRVPVNLNRNTDADIINFLSENVDNINGYLKSLIRKDIESRK